MVKILMVCLGNICRSPMAQGVLEQKLKQNSITAFVDSAGTASYHVGDCPDQRATNKSKEKGIDISQYRGRQFTVDDFDDFDFIYVMDNYNLKDILSLARNESDMKKVDLILNKIFPGEDMSVPDPYYGGDEGFDNVYNLLNEACEKIISELVYD